MARDPYCQNCGYSLVGLTESSKCPECGKPLVEILVRPASGASYGRRYRSDIIIFGLPLVHIALGPYEDERVGKARGIFALGDVAIGWFAFGGVATGLVAFGGLAFGLVAWGGIALGLLAFGGLAVGGAAVGGGAAGGAGLGGGALAYVAQGSGAKGYYARGGMAVGTYVIRSGRQDPEAVRFFDEWSWLFGAGTSSAYLFAIWVVVGALAIAILLAIVVLGAYVAGQRAPPELR